MFPLRKLLVVLASAGLCLPLAAQTAESRWAHLGADGRLIYAHSPHGDRIPDFSSAGYRGGGVAIPQVKTVLRLSPDSDPDDTPRIQKALDEVGGRPAAERGAVELAPGVYHLAGTLRMDKSRVVLRGSGATGKDVTLLEMTGAPHMAVELIGELHQQTLSPATTLTDPYVAAGAVVIHLADASTVHAGDTLQIVKPVTPAWIHFMGMDQLSRDGSNETWLDSDIPVRRRVQAVSGNAVLLEVPLTDSFDSKFYPGIQPAVTRVEVTGQISEVGVENLKIAAPKQTVAFREDPEFDGLHIDRVVDAWARDLEFEDITTPVRIERDAERMTLTRVNVIEHESVTSHAKPFFFSVNGSQILIDRCTGTGNTVTYVATQSRSEGPVVVLHCRFDGDGMIEGHQRWSTGLLVDGCDIPGGSINLRNRGEMGSGHGWAIGWSVLWNNHAGSLVVQNPPGVANWTIGDQGPQQRAPMPRPGLGKRGQPLLAGGVTESPGKHVKPESLYLQQLRDRLGPPAIAAIGYE